MKKLLPILAILFVLFLLVTTPWKQEPAADFIDRVKLVEVNRLGGTMAVFCGKDDAAVYFLDLTEASFADESGKAASLQSLRPGMVIEMDWNGQMRLSSPAGISAAAVRIAAQEDDLVGLYLSALTGLWEEHSALIRDAKQIDLNLAALTHLSSGEQAALGYLASCKMGYVSYDLTPHEGLTAEDSVAFTLLPEGDPADGTFSFTAELRRGSGDSILTRYAVSRGEDGQWSCTAQP